MGAERVCSGTEQPLSAAKSANSGQAIRQDVVYHQLPWQEAREVTVAKTTRRIDDCPPGRWCVARHETVPVQA